MPLAPGVRRLARTREIFHCKPQVVTQTNALANAVRRAVRSFALVIST